MTILDTWQQIHAWCEENAPEALTQLRPGVVGPGIERAEATLGVALPEDYRRSLQVHDGDSMATGLLAGWTLSPLAEVVDAWRMLKGLLDQRSFSPNEDRSLTIRGPIRPYWWRPAWIPITSDGAGNHHMLDLDPPGDGTVGQIILYRHDAGVRHLVAESFAAHLSGFAADLRAGRCEPDYSPEGELFGISRREP
jgi:cell wall assembly regulator SMI1